MIFCFWFNLQIKKECQCPALDVSVGNFLKNSLRQGGRPLNVEIITESVDEKPA
jgi:hypothetical protein